MTAWELFNFMRDLKHDEFITSGDDVQWIVKVDHNEKVVRLIFEESCGKVDWKNNLNFPKKLYKKQESCLLASRGWGNAYKSCNDEIMSVLVSQSAILSDYDVHICGWSYGGAMAVLAAEDFFYRTHKKASVYTFGVPKVLYGKKTRDYVRNCVNEAKQWTNTNDIVPLLPPFALYTRLSTDYCGCKRSLIKLLNPWKYHTRYGDKDIYL